MSINSDANQYTNDGREQKCWDNYLNSIRKGEKNAYKAAVDAGYSEDHARNITAQGWFRERLDGLRRTEIVSKSEKKFDEVLDLPAITKEGETDTNILRVQVDVAKYATGTLAKHIYSTKTEVDHKNDGGKFEAGEISPALLALTKEYEEKMKNELLK